MRCIRHEHGVVGNIEDVEGFYGDTDGSDEDIVRDREGAGLDGGEGEVEAEVGWGFETSKEMQKL